MEHNKKLGETLRYLAKHDKRKLAEILNSLTEEEAEQILYDWSIWGRDNQQYNLDGDENITCWLAGRGFGKLFYPDTDVLTENKGWIKLSEIKVGDKVFDENGEPCNVLAVHEPPIEKISQTYEIFFSDKTSLKTCGDHQWVTWTHRDRKQFLRNPENGTFPPKDWVNFKGDIYKTYSAGRYKVPKDSYGPTIKTTQEIVDTFRQNTKRADLNHCIPVCKPIQFEEKPLSIDPYIFGYWLGDGGSGSGSFTCDGPDQQSLINYAKDIGYDLYLTKAKRGNALYCRGLITKLKAIGVDRKDYIPDDYLLNSENNRLKFLQGFMDSDGYTDGKHVEFCTKTKLHAEVVYYLAVSLGQRPVTTEGRATLYGKDYGIKYRVMWTPTINCFFLERKKEKFNYNNVGQSSRQQHRMLSDYKKIDPVEGMRCITVDSPNHMWLVGKNLIPTHNTRLGAEALKKVIASGVKDALIVAPTSTDLRETIAEGPSGVLSVYSPNDPNKPTYVPSKSRIEYPNGARVRLLSAEEEDRGRGGNPQWVWYDELSSYKSAGIFHQVQLSLRRAPAKAIVTTTPKATPLMIELSKRFGKDVKVISGSTYDNEDNLSENFIHGVRASYEGTTLGSQEIHGVLLLSSEDALWQRQTIVDNTIHESNLPRMVAYALGVDPAVSKSKYSDLTGLVLVGLGEDDNMYILGDWSGKVAPQELAQRVSRIYNEYSRLGPMTVVVEKNAGGMYIKDTLQRNHAFLPVKETFSSTNKMSRASPIALLAEQGKIKHVEGVGLAELENEMVSFDGKGKNRSPDRLDSFVFAATHLSPFKKNRIVTKEFLL